jgi:hypothetical protein
MTDQTEPTDEEKPEAIQDLETLDAALGELEDNGADADSETLEAAADVIQGLLDTAEAEDAGDSEAVAELEEGRDAVLDVADGGADEATVDMAGEVISVVGQQLQMTILQAALGGQA